MELAKDLSSIVINCLAHGATSRETITLRKLHESFVGMLDEAMQSFGQEIYYPESVTLNGE